MKISDLDIKIVANHLRLNEEDIDATEEMVLNTYLEASKKYIQNYTGLTEAQMDEAGDLTVACLVLCQDMYDNRSIYADTNNVNRTIDIILSMHRINLL